MISTIYKLLNLPMFFSSTSTLTIIIIIMIAINNIINTTKYTAQQSKSWLPNMLEMRSSMPGIRMLLGGTLKHRAAPYPAKRLNIRSI